MKNMLLNTRQKKCFIFGEWIFGSYYDYRFYRILGDAAMVKGMAGSRKYCCIFEPPQRLGRRQMPKPPAASSTGIFDKLYRKVTGWNGTIPLKKERD
jgi:hypothetical protein